jgi:hypothetical protein
LFEKRGGSRQNSHVPSGDGLAHFEMVLHGYNLQIEVKCLMRDLKHETAKRILSQGKSAFRITAIFRYVYDHTALK